MKREPYVKKKKGERARELPIDYKGNKTALHSLHTAATAPIRTHMTHPSVPCSNYYFSLLADTACAFTRLN